MENLVPSKTRSRLENEKNIRVKTRMFFRLTELIIYTRIVVVWKTQCHCKIPLKTIHETSWGRAAYQVKLCPEER